MILRLSLAVLRLFAKVVPARDRDEWLAEWESELQARRERLASHHRLTPEQELDMFRRVLGSFHDAAWLRRQFTLDADVVHDFKHGARLLLRSPGFALLTISVLATGIGATTGIFSVVDALLVRRLPYHDPERIVLVFETDAANRRAIEGVAPANFLDWHPHVRSLEAVSAVEPFGFTYTEGAEPQSMPGARVSRGFFEAFGVAAMYGRTFTPEEFSAGRNNVVVLSYGTWAQRFGADPALVGRVVRINGQPTTIVGVMPPSFAPRLMTTFNERGVWAPKVWAEYEHRLRGSRHFNAVARLKPGFTTAQAQSEMEGIAERLAQQHPGANRGKTMQLVTLRDHLAGDLRSSINVLGASVLLLLVIAIANAANLITTRSAARTREIGVRSALGADRGRLVRQLLAETLLLTGVGCLLGLLVAYATARLIVSLAPGDIPALTSIGLNSRVLLFSTALTFAVAMLTGIVPAWRGAGIRASDACRRSSGRPEYESRGALANRTTGRAGAFASGFRGSRFVIAELALAFVLLAGSGLLLRSFATLLATSPGFAPEGVAALQIFVRGPSRTPAQMAAYYQHVIEAMKAAPHVREVGAVSVMPFLNTTGGSSVPIVIDGQAAPAPGDEPSALLTVATPGYFPAMRIPLLEGRLFDGHDDANRAPVALVSSAFARRHWSTGSPVGQRIRIQVQGNATAAEVVGVVGDVRHDTLDRPATTEVFVPHAQLPYSGMTFVARTYGNPEAALPDLKSRIHTAAPGQAVYRTAVLQDLVEGTLHDRRFMLTLMLAFAFVAVVLAASGVYGVMSLVSAQRTREFGVRLALGAARGEILRMVMRQGVALTTTGLAIGLAGALAGGRILQRFLFGIGPNDLLTLSAVSAALGMVAAIACLLPALRATRVSPIVALRAE
jgi:putative ABC transport system permease protein